MALTTKEEARLRKIFEAKDAEREFRTANQTYQKLFNERVQQLRDELDPQHLPNIKTLREAWEAKLAEVE